MSERQGFDPAYVAALLVVAAVAVIVIADLLPTLMQLVWQAAPSILILAIIFAVLSAMIRKLLD